MSWATGYMTLSEAAKYVEDLAPNQQLELVRIADWLRTRSQMLRQLMQIEGKLAKDAAYAGSEYDCCHVSLLLGQIQHWDDDRLNDVRDYMRDLPIVRSTWESDPDFQAALKKPERSDWSTKDPTDKKIDALAQAMQRLCEQRKTINNTIDEFASRIDELRKSKRVPA